MHFIEYFDWSQIEVLDFQYYKVRIERFDDHPHLVGRDALIEKQYVKVFFSEPQAGSD